MFRFFLCITLLLVHVFCRTTKDHSQFDTDSLITQPGPEDMITDQTEQPLQFHTDDEISQSWKKMTTESPLESIHEDNTTQVWKEFTTEETFEEENLTATIIQQIASTVPTVSNTTCPPSITADMLEEIIEAVVRNITREMTSRLEEMEERLSTLNCSNNSSTVSMKLSWLIYENLQIPLSGWLRVFDQPYSHKTRLADLNQIAAHVITKRRVAASECVFCSM